MTPCTCQNPLNGIVQKKSCTVCNEKKSARFSKAQEGMQIVANKCNSITNE